MKKILLFISLVIFVLVAFFVIDIYKTVSGNPNTTYGHLMLRDRSGKIITDKGRSGGYALPYSGALDTDLVTNILEIEDARYYEHSGINLSAKVASIYQNISAGAVVRGGSTITEQYIKNAYYSNSSRTITQKIREAIGAITIEGQYSKDDILRKYLSTVYMGNGLYGIATVIEDHPDNDTILDIITRLKYPNISQSNREVVLAYRSRVSDRIGKKGEITHLEEKSRKPSIDIFPMITNRVDNEISSYCSGYKNTLKKWTTKIPNNICESGKISLTITIDSSLMNESMHIARGILDSLRGKNVTNAQIYITDPMSDTILAYIGNTNISEQIDMITRRRSVGSLLKPFIYLLALEKGADTEDYLLDDRTAYETNTEGKYFVPENYNPKSYGPIRLREALGNSLNSATVRLTDTLSIPVVYDFLRSVGLDLDHDVGYYGYGISLGMVELTMENIVDSYRSLIDTTDLNKWQIAQVLSDSRNRARTFGISSILNTSIPLPVKTGTSTDFRDNWTISYSRDAIIGVWVGNSDGSSMGDISGVSGAGPIWHGIAEYMIAVGYIKPQKSLPSNGLHQIAICLDTACLRRELLYSTKSESPKSRPSEGLYFRSDFFGNISTDEMKKWKIQQ
ncbi:transglycosylase domain-containing protein [Candidatus Gracilibacteria bacterium]|nr:transglycosylase domain-containing protein [Candidatus Gracilibacteria bacterium]